MANHVRCWQDGPCFARSPADKRRCTILREEYPEGYSCPFQKPIRSLTNGITYDMNLECCSERKYDTSSNPQFKFKG